MVKKDKRGRAPGSKRPPGSGRKPGTPNKVTASVKHAFKEAFDKMGGVDALVTWGKEYPTDFYKLASKLIPTEITGQVEGAVKVVVEFPVPPPNSIHEDET